MCSEIFTESGLFPAETFTGEKFSQILRNIAKTQHYFNILYLANKSAIISETFESS